MNMISGTVFVNGVITIGEQGSTGTMMMEGGSVETTGDLNLGRRIHEEFPTMGTATITGGTLIIGDDIKIGNIDDPNNPSTGQMNIAGTVVEAGDLIILDGNLHLGEGGTLVINRNRETRIHEYIGSGLITSESDIIDVSYDSGTNETIISFAVPFKVITPNGGESWISGTVQDILWSADPAIKNIYLEYRQDDDSDWIAIDPNTENDGEYVWTIPDIISDQCLVRVSVPSEPNALQDPNLPDDTDIPHDPNVFDISDEHFSIVCHLDLPSNLDNDCDVGPNDLAIMTGDWLSTDSVADIAPLPDGDGIVDLNDFRLLAVDWLRTGDPDALLFGDP